MNGTINQSKQHNECFTHSKKFCSIMFFSHASTEYALSLITNSALVSIYRLTMASLKPTTHNE